MKYLNLIVLTVLMSMIGVKAFAYDAKINGIYYNFFGSEAEVTCLYSPADYSSNENAYTGNVVIPESVIYNGKTYSVTSIGYCAFRICKRLKSITIPNSVTSIGYGAFEYCSGLESITIPNSVTSIGSYAFFDCSGLTSITIPNSVTAIEDYEFYYCSSLTSIIIPNSVTSIGEKAFEGCSNLTSITIPNSVTSIGNYAFNKCTGLTSVAISVTDLAAFCNNKIVSLINNKIGKPIRLIDAEGKEIKEFTIPNSVTSIGNYAFYNCTGLTNITIPNNVTTIGEEAFYNTRLKSVIIGSGVISIGSNAFNNNNYNGHRPIKVIWLTNTPPKGYTNVNALVNYVANESYGFVLYKYPFLSSFFEVDGVKYVPVSPSERTCHAIDCTYNESIEKISIGKIVSFNGIDMTVKNVNEYVFSDNPFIKEVDLSFDGNLGNNAFEGCTNLKNVIVQNVGNIGEYAFKSCKSITKAEIKNKGYIGKSAFSYITAEYTAILNNKGAIGSKAFYKSTGLKTLKIGENVTDIASEAFSGCTNLETANLQNKGKIADKVFQGCTAMKAAILGEEITSIGQYAFDGCKNLQSIVIPDTVTSLGNYAFNNCTSMTSAKIGSNVTTIDSNAFSNCSALTKIEIPQSMTKIEDYVFRGCKSLKEVIMADRKADNKALTLGSNGSSPLFADCPLDSVYIGRNISYSTSSSYGYSPFYRNTSLRSVTITDKETEISPNEFYGCTNLKNVSIGDGVESIGDWAFSGCSSLDYFAFGSSVKTIGKEAFSDCTAMTRLISRSATPPTCGSQALDDINKWNCTLSVPTGATTAYQQADQWKEFFFIDNNISGISKLTNTIATPNHIYDLKGRKLKEPSKGINIIGRKKVVVK